MATVNMSSRQAQSRAGVLEGEDDSYISLAAEYLSSLAPSDRTTAVLSKARDDYIVPIGKATLKWGWLPLILVIGCTDLYSGPRVQWRTRYFG
jgi:hypothetical protein